MAEPLNQVDLAHRAVHADFNLKQHHPLYLEFSS